MPPEPTARYRERLRVPLGWWLLGAVAVGVVWLVAGAAGGTGLAAPLSSVAAVVVAAGLLAYGRVEVRVDTDGFTAGRARLPVWAVGAVTPLDAGATRALAGPQADRRAFHLLRGYVRTSVRVEVDDPGDPTPSWLVSTRHPERVATALAAAVRTRPPGRG